MGKNAKFVITGDMSQIDLPKNQRSGLVVALGLLNKIKGVSVIHLDNNDVIRHKLVKDIIKAFEINKDKQ